MSSTPLRAPRPLISLGLLVALTAASLAAVLVDGQLPAAAADVGHRDFSYGSSVTAPTGQKPQSKLWFNDGLWWGSLFNTASVDAGGAFEIYRYDRATHTWTTTGAIVDERTSGSMDVLWDGTHLYVTTAGKSVTDANHSARVLRFSYDPATKMYTRDFRVTVTNAGMEAITIAKDSTGQLWVSYVQGTKVWISHSSGSDSNWVTPFQLPVGGADNVAKDDDISAIVAFDGNKVGIMWSNTVDMNMYFATHADGTDPTAWTSAIAYGGDERADDHINLKSLQSDRAGRVFAAVKTSKNGASDPLVHLLVLDEGGTWTSHVFGVVADDHTRAIVLIDNENRNLYMFASSPCCSGGVIYYKQTSLDTISFPTGKGTPFIQSSTDPKINNPTSTKQNLNGTTDLIVMGGDDSTRYYLHNTIDLAGGDADTTAPETTITDGPTGSTSSTTATFTYDASEAGSTFECALDGAAFASCDAAGQTYSELTEAVHNFEVRATDADGNVDSSPATRTWTVDLTAPTVINVSPADGSTEVSLQSAVTATFSEGLDASSVNGTTFTLTKDGTTSPLAATVSYDSSAKRATLVAGESFELLATYTARLEGGAGGIADLAGNSLAAAQVWTFTTADPQRFADDFESGDFSQWTQVVTGGDGRARVLAGIGKDQTSGAEFYESSNTRSRAYARKTLDTAESDISLSAEVRVTEEGTSGNVPFMRLLDADGGRVVSVIRRSGSGRIDLQYGGTTYQTKAFLPLNADFAALTVHVVVGGSGTSVVELYVDGSRVYQVTYASLSSPVRQLQLGNDDGGKKALTVIADNVSARVGV